jgi:hypothetical protein
MWFHMLTQRSLPLGKCLMCIASCSLLSMPTVSPSDPSVKGVPLLAIAPRRSRAWTRQCRSPSAWSRRYDIESLVTEFGRIEARSRRLPSAAKREFPASGTASGKRGEFLARLQIPNLHQSVVDVLTRLHGHKLAIVRSSRDGAFPRIIALADVHLLDELSRLGIYAGDLRTGAEENRTSIRRDMHITAGEVGDDVRAEPRFCGS